jgi:Spy/CpxP family protein refolding chaperone
MHPFKAWRYARRAFAGCGEHGPLGRGCGPQSSGDPEMEGFDEDFGSFGVRRPLRFMAHKLHLDERQVAELARILDELKTERAQAAVDRRRTVAAFADALSGDAFDAAKAAEGGDLRVQSAARLREAVLQALGRMHAVLNAEQRVRLAYLIRTGTLLI